MQMPFEIFLIRLAAALLGGLLIGIEREIKNKDAGMRTHALVALGSAIYMLVALDLLAQDGTTGDITRVAGQVATGVGFLGGGVILKTQGSVQGLTTAATIWCCSAVGTLAGAGLLIETFTCVALILFITWLLQYIELRIKKPKNNENH
jgi:putative Mg2+ transporter-C (MgtC) family protein